MSQPLYSHDSSHLPILPHPGQVMRPEAFLDFVAQRAEEMLRTRDQALLLLCGPSGAGKTTLAEAILRRPTPFQKHLFDVDRFFGDTRPARNQMVMDPHTTSREWWGREYNWPLLARVLGKVRALGQGGGVVDQERVYRGGNFHTDPASVQMSVAPGKRLVVAPGHEFHLAARDAGYADADMIRAVALRDPRQALKAALIRDLKDAKVAGPAGISERLEFRAREHNLQESVYDEVIHQTDVVVVDNHELPLDWTLVTAEQRELLEALFRAWDAPRVHVRRPV